MTMLKTSGCYAIDAMSGTHSNVQENRKEPARKPLEERMDVRGSSEEVIWISCLCY